jgi:hypothetical protein
MHGVREWQALVARARVFWLLLALAAFAAVAALLACRASQEERPSAEIRFAVSPTGDPSIHHDSIRGGVVADSVVGRAERGGVVVQVHIRFFDGARELGVLVAECTPREGSLRSAVSVPVKVLIGLPVTSEEVLLRPGKSMSFALGPAGQN